MPLNSLIHLAAYARNKLMTDCQPNNSNFIGFCRKSVKLKADLNSPKFYRVRFKFVYLARWPCGWRHGNVFG